MTATKQTVTAWRSKFPRGASISIPDGVTIYTKYILGKSIVLETSKPLNAGSTEVMLCVRESSYFHVRWFSKGKVDTCFLEVVNLVKEWNECGIIKRWANVKQAQRDSLYFEFSKKMAVTSSKVQEVFRLLESRPNLMYQLGEKDRYRGSMNTIIAIPAVPLVKEESTTVIRNSLDELEERQCTTMDYLMHMHLYFQY
eukprot:TRINITY_DN2001_c2_g1_i1.p1 TRINITY_DN2001_c2_g1~~TRINITY_DN2001_c2_g1_i1.p1  ORF type:complete len:198 (+),score=24.39 TRINITY_DN2001_c2_g1_i1:59-652(+)